MCIIIFSLLINAVILLLNCFVLILYLYIHFSSLFIFHLLKHHFDLNITNTALKVSRSLYCFTTSISYCVENYFPRLWGTGISDAIFGDIFTLNADYIAWKLLKMALVVEYMMEYQHPVCWPWLLFSRSP